MADLVLKTASGDEYRKTVGDGTAAQQQLDLFRKGHVPYSDDWFEADDGTWVRRDAVVAAWIAEEGGVT